jgi:aminopeptidase N
MRGTTPSTRNRRRRTTVTIAMTVALAFTALTTTIAGAGGPIPTPGADGIGDAYFPLAGNGGYDVNHYDLDVRYAPPTNVLKGVATIDADATQELSSLNLDFVGMHIDSLTVNGVPAGFARAQRHELMITPAAPIGDTEDFTVVVAYHGIPKSFIDDGLRMGALHTNDGVLILGEPEVAAVWFPVNDHPRDKATYDINLTVTNNLEAISNGLLHSTDPAGPGRTTWSWHVSQPMASYLAFVAIGHFRIHRSRTAGGIPVIDAVDPQLGHIADSSLAKEERVIRFLRSQFGPYPFDALGGVVDKAPIGFALENQTRPVYSTSFFDGGTNTVVVVHELAHQWFGDSVAVHDWQHIWLNEGFATYAEWLWNQERGFAGPRGIAAFYCDAIPPGDGFWDVPPGDPGADDLFNGAVYIRGALTLQALRGTVGASAFFQILRQWVANQGDGSGTGTTDDFIALSESVSGSSLQALFDEWLLTPGKPASCLVPGLPRGAGASARRIGPHIRLPRGVRP